jgi:hypothetical protein
VTAWQKGKDSVSFKAFHVFTRCGLSGLHRYAVCRSSMNSHHINDPFGIPIYQIMNARFIYLKLLFSRRPGKGNLTHWTPVKS